MIELDPAALDAAGAAPGRASPCSTRSTSSDDWLIAFMIVVAVRGTRQQRSQDQEVERALQQLDARRRPLR